MSSENEQLVQVKFVTNNKKFAVTDAPITVPTRLRRYGLSEVINHLLALEKPVPFDFLVKGEFLRTSIDKYLATRGLSNETLLTIEYVETILPPSELSGYQHDDWVAAVKGSHHGLIITGSYDNLIRVWDESHNCIVTLKGHTKPVKTLCWLPNNSNSEGFQILSGSDDQSIRLWKFSTHSKIFEEMAEFKSHQGTITGLSSNELGNRFVSSSWDGKLKIWDPHFITAEVPNEQEQNKDSRKRKTVASDSKRTTETPLVTMEGHNNPVTSVQWSQLQSNSIVSGGWDNSIKIWDASTAVNTLSLITEKPLNGLSVSQKSGLIVSGHTDNSTRVWDPRVQDGVVVKMKLLSHTGWVTSVSWSLKDTFTLISASHDQTIKVWDIRSSTPLHTLNAHEGKVLAVDWTDQYILSGATDNYLKIHRIRTETVTQ